MIKEIIKLIKPGTFIPCFEVENIDNKKIVVRPEFLSICAADMRYFKGNRPSKILEKKLPLALIHEAIGKVIYDPSGNIPVGSYCVLLPGGNDINDDKSNYRENAFFRSSSRDGFCQELIQLNPEEIILIDSKEDPKEYVFTELLSVCCHAIRRAFSISSNLTTREVHHIGIWGDGIMSYMMAYSIKKLLPQYDVTVIGKHEEKLQLFSFVDGKYSIYDAYDHKQFDLVFECVGGNSSHKAINDAIIHLNPCGILVLTGVSEESQCVNTRKILEKGIVLIGCTDLIFLNITKSLFQCLLFLIPQNNISLPHIHHLNIQITTFSAVDTV